MEKIKHSGSEKTAKGYRLKNSTHKLIEKIQLLIDGSKDTVISKAVKLYYAQLSKQKEIPEATSKKFSRNI